MSIQFDTRRDRHGWTVFDRGTDRPVVLTQALQSGLSYLDADDLAHRLNSRRLDGNLSLLR